MSDRERFEAWHHIKYKGRADQFFEKDAAGEYVDSILRYEFYAYQAATAAADADLTQSVQMYVDAARERDEAIAAEIKAEANKWAAVRACVDVINCYSYVGDRSKEMLVAVKAEFPEAFK